MSSCEKLLLRYSQRNNSVERPKSGSDKRSASVYKCSLNMHHSFSLHVQDALLSAATRFKRKEKKRKERQKIKSLMFALLRSLVFLSFSFPSSLSHNLPTRRSCNVFQHVWRLYHSLSLDSYVSSVGINSRDAPHHCWNKPVSHPARPSSAPQERPPEAERGSTS